MRAYMLAALLFFFSTWEAAGQESCLERDPLIRLDSGWERALLESDAERLQTLLADDFIWVHNHASAVDTKTSLLERMSNRGTGATTRSRTQSEVEARALGSTAIVTGFTVVDRGQKPTRYSFMRTYAEVSGRCQLLANHTMEVPESDE